MENRKIIIFSAPSGAGKTSIIRNIIDRYNCLSFSISATTRKRRDTEVEGLDYYFLEPTDFFYKVQKNEFVEFEEVYKGCYYGTLKSEINRIWDNGKHVLFDIDVKGAMNIKSKYPDESLMIFISPPSLDILRKRLESRGTESEESISNRLFRAQKEMLYADHFNHIVINENLELTVNTVDNILREFISL